jgi:hypothetical protein
MSIWVPSIPRRRLPALIRVTLLSALFAGGYGAVHDQVSYTISSEYFTRFKFRQFADADFGWPARVFVGEVGFLATWWVGLIGGWILARMGLAELSERSPWYFTARTWAIAGAVAILCGGLGGLLGVAHAQGDLSSWREWQETLELENLSGFVIVAYLHWGSYLGGLLGIILASVYVEKTVAAPVSEASKVAVEAPTAEL